MELDGDEKTSGTVVPWSVAIALNKYVPVAPVTNEIVFDPPGDAIITLLPCCALPVMLNSSIINGPLPPDSVIV